MKKVRINFQIYDSKDPNEIIIIDTSDWGPILDKPSIIEIIVPGDDEPMTHYYDKNSINILNSHNLGLSCLECGDDELAPLPDGVYQITVKGSPDNFKESRLYLKTTGIQSEIDSKILEDYSDCDNCNDDVSKYIKYNDLIEVARAFVRKGFLCEAQEIIEKISKLINKKNCKRCPHKV